MKQLLILLCLVVMLPIGIRAQEDHDIAASFNLNEVVVLPDGMTFEEYLVKQVLENAKPLKKRLQTLRYSVTCKPPNCDLCSQARRIRADSEGTDGTQGVWHHDGRGCAVQQGQDNDVQRAYGGDETEADGEAGKVIPKTRRYDERQRV